LKTIAQFAGINGNWLATASLIRRFNRFLWTAFPNVRGTVNPKREGLSSSIRKQKAAK